jgi:hypothetical protein
MTNWSVIILKEKNIMDNTFRRRVSQIHGSFIIVLGLALGIYINSVPSTGFGVYGFLRDNAFAVAGLSQAYFLMAIIGLALRIGSRKDNSGVWNWLGALAHMPPLLATVMYIGSMIEVGVAHVLIGSVTMHLICVGFEVAAALSKEPAAQPSTTLVIQ